MKTKKLFFIVSLLILGGFFKGNSQTNSVNAVFTSTPNGVNTSLGYLANTFPTVGGVTPQGNTFIGALAGRYHTQGGGNTFIGYVCGGSFTSGFYNTGLGFGALEDYGLAGTSQYNIGIGYYAGNTVQSNDNIFIGRSCGSGLTTGGLNTFIGRVTVPSSPSTTTVSGNDVSNTIILADGGGTQRLYINGANGYAGIGLPSNQIPQNKLEINSTGSFSGTPGLRFRNFSNTNYNTVAPTSNRRVLTINNVGDVILVDDVVGTGTGAGITTNCTNNINIIPKNLDVNGNLTCSQIFDNGTSVGIATTSNFGFITGTTVGTLFQNGTGGVGNGNFKLDVNGVTRSLAFWASSDKRFKKEIKSIESPLETIQKIDGKTYFWNKEANKEMNFDNGLHSGFLAQELEKVLPHLVATDEKGNKAVNYMELMPYLVEAIKEQQIQINDLKTQISDNFKAQNQELIELTNTKIISVSPNPSKDVITISFNIEKSVQNASLQVYDLNGKMLSSLTIKERENNISKTFQKDNFGTGVYIVSLVVNGKSIDSKKIIFE